MNVPVTRLSMAVRVLAIRRATVGVKVGMTTMARRVMQVELPGVAPRPKTDADQGEPYPDLDPPLGSRRNGQAAPREQAAGDEHREGMAHAPAETERSGGTQPRIAAHERADCDHVVDLEGMRRTKSEGGRVRGPDCAHRSLLGGD
jgi:hypothetical protein